MNGRRLLAAVIVGSALVAGTFGTTQAAQPDLAAPNCFGQLVSTMARMHGGIGQATAHHNAMHNTNLSVGEYLEHVRAMCNS